MPLTDVTIGRICLHEVHRRPEEGPQLTPTYGQGLLNLPPEAMAAFRSRVVAAFKASSQCLDMAIRDYADGSVAANGAKLIDLSNKDFVAHSRAFADALASAQGSRQIPGGLLVVFDGTVGYPATRFFGLMKAELHEGFIKTNDLQAQFVNNLFLSPKTKLYKIGIFICDGAHPRPPLPEGWQATVYDSAMTASQRDNAATYFYSTFLGLDLPDNSAQKVKRFFEETKAFIRSSPLTPSQKVDLHNGLYSYLKLDQSQTVQVSRFAETYMQGDLLDDYVRHMKRQRIPETAISKDLTEVSGALRIRKLRFPRAITLSGPPDAMRDLVSIETIERADGSPWTRVIIKAEVQGDE
jgi:hypothetical protein